MTGRFSRSPRGRRAGPRATVGVIDFFSGCGGMSYGFATASTKHVTYKIRGALDMDRHANATYERMLGVAPARIDIRQASRPEVLRQLVKQWGLAKGDPLVVIGCSPCQGFSSHRKKDHRFDPRNSLLDPFAKVVLQLRPDLVVMENVPEMLRKEHWRHFLRWRSRLEAAGYTVRAQIHSLAQFGVPQERYRALVIAARDWRFFQMPRPFVPPDRFVTVRDAIGDLPPLDAGGVDPIDPMHRTSRHRPETVERLRHIPPDGGSRRSLPPSMAPRCLRRVDGFRDVYGRLAWDRPAVAITARCRTPSCGRFAHPVQHRGLSIREAALLQGFPEDFYLEGPFDDCFKQIGNAVSPIFARAIAEHLDREWLDEHSRELHPDETREDILGPFVKSFSSSIAAMKRRLRSEPKSRALSIA